MTSKRICRAYVLLNGINDVAYFGFLILQFLLIVPVLGALLPEEKGSMSVVLTITLITSQLLFQIFAEGPTGALADARGRAWAIAMSFWCRLGAVGLLVVCVHAGITPESPTPAVCAAAALLILAQVLTATGEAFLEGSVEAWLRDECEQASPERYMKRVNKAFEHSAIVQNGAALAASAVVLVVWRFSGAPGGLFLTYLAGGLFLAGALIARGLSKQEAGAGRGVRTAKADAKVRTARVRTVSVVVSIMREAVREVFTSEHAGVRQLIAILILPFPCWIMLSWFYTSFARSGGPGDAAGLPDGALLWLGLTLGVARVLGACVGKRLCRDDDGSLRSVFEKSVFFNVALLFGAALLLVLRPMVEGRIASWAGVGLFLSAVALAKGSEEVIKLSKNKFLASALPNPEVRATTLSLVSVAQNAFGFVVISLSGLLAFGLTDSDARQPVIIFVVCASAGVAGWLIYRGGKRLTGAAGRPAAASAGLAP